MASGTVRSFDITDLAKWSCYGIQIRAVTIKNGKWSDEISQRTSEYGKMIDFHGWIADLMID